MAALRQFCTFLLGEQLYGLDVLRVQEVVRAQPLTPAPLAHPVVRGLINLRGQIVTTIDLRLRLDLPERADASEPMNVVVQTDDGAVSLLVDEIGEVVEVAEDQFAAPPPGRRSAARDVIVGAYRLPERLLIVLDPDRAVSLPEASGGGP